MGRVTLPRPADKPGPFQHEKGSVRMRETIQLRTGQREELVNITAQVKDVVRRSGVGDGLLGLYAYGATAAIMIQEGWDASVQTDAVDLLRRLVPQGVWRHDAQDGNGDAHLKAGIVGPSETVPIMGGGLGLSRWQDVFFCEFDGPRTDRKVICTVLALHCRHPGP